MTDEQWMQRALTLAHKAETLGEVPVGAVVVHRDECVGEGYNQPIGSYDPTAHAEIIAIRQAARKLRNYRLLDTTLYVTLEPCPMCVGAIIHARIGRVVFGAYDVKRKVAPNHAYKCVGGVLEVVCKDQLKQFFQQRR